ncbi:MAG: LysE family translocator [Alphaproteobacteria bacterium]|nr:LysE family translocator [Alphaproteobacteria bacterium]
MSLETWLAFVAASIVLVVIPGPTITLVISYALAHGKRSAWATVPGVALGDFTALALSLAGLGALLATSALAFTILKFAGAAYLLYLGIRLWRSPVAPIEAEVAGIPASRSILLHLYVVTALNPKGILFFLAFLPQFLRADMPAAPQVAVLGGTFLVIATANAALYALLAGQMQAWLRGVGARRALNRVSGAMLVVLGGAMALARRSD